MGEKELREKYGGKLDKAVNRAIRAETPEGNAALDLLAALSGPAAHSRWTDSFGNPTPEAAAYYKHYERAVGPLIAKVCKAYGISPGDVAPAPAPRRKKRRAR